MFPQPNSNLYPQFQNIGRNCRDNMEPPEDLEYNYELENYKLENYGITNNPNNFGGYNNNQNNNQNTEQTLQQPVQQPVQQATFDNRINRPNRPMSQSISANRITNSNNSNNSLTNNSTSSSNNLTNPTNILSSKKTSQSFDSANYQALTWRQHTDKNLAVPAIQFSIYKYLSWDIGYTNLLTKSYYKPKSYWEAWINRLNNSQRKFTLNRLVDHKFSAHKNLDERQVQSYYNQQKIDQKLIIQSESNNPATNLTYYGLTHIGDLSNFDSRYFGVDTSSRLGHTVITGNSGFGKSSLMLSIFYQDILQGRGGALITSDNSSCIKILNCIPKAYHSRIVYWRPGSSMDGEDITDFGIDLFDSANPRTSLETVLSIFQSVWQGESTDKISYYLDPILHLIKDNPDFARFSDYRRIIEDDAFRSVLLENCKDTKTIRFWQNLQPKEKTEIQSTLIKLEYINRNQLILNVLENNHNVLRLRDIIENDLILIADLSLLPEGETSSRLVGNLLIKKLTECVSKSFFGVFVDEFWNYNGQDILSRTYTLRQNNLALCYSQQAIIGNTVSESSNQHLQKIRHQNPVQHQ